VAVDGITARSFEALRDWPQEALDHLHAAFRRKAQGAGPTWADLLAEVKGQFGLDWNDSSLSRYYGYWRSTLRIEEQAREEAEAIVSRLTDTPTPDLVAAARQLLQQQRLLALTRMEAADPTTVVQLGLRADRLALDERKLEVERKRVDLLEQRIAAMQAAAGRAKDALERVAKKTQLAPEDLQTIREQLYGIAA
jgi:hypothetical protein